MRRKRSVFVVLGLSVLCAGLVWRFAPFHRNTTANAQAPQQVPVTAGTAETRSVPVYVEGLGSVQAFNTVTVKAQVGGQITKVFFREGQEVKAGDSLFQIDPRPFEAALQQAQATKEKDEAQLQSAQLDLDRAAKLLVPGFQTRQGYDQQTATVGQLQASLRADEAQIANAQLNIDIASAGNTDVVRSKLKVMAALGLKDKIEDILITLSSQYHLIRIAQNSSSLFLYVALNRGTANLGMARFKLAEVEQNMSI